MKNAIFGYSTPNVGDDVQALAAALLLPSVDAYVNRDALDQVRLSERHRVVMNSWFAVKRYRAVPSSSLSPIYHGFCVGRPELLNDTWEAEWRSRGSIGCRDRYSVDTLRQRGIAAHFTGCLTTFMGGFFEQPAKREGVVFVDVPEGVQHHIPRELQDRAEFVTAEIDKGLSQVERWYAAAKLLDRLRTAEMVVTRRLHAALPCVGFKTPVTVYLENDIKNRRRFGGSDEILPMIFHDGEEPIDNRPGWRTPEVCSASPEMEEHFQALTFGLGTNFGRRWTSVTQFVLSLPNADVHRSSLWSRLLTA
jgi:hypothetical protein